MFYVKNVPTLERVIRIFMGLALLGGALTWMGTTPTGWDPGRHGHDGCLEWPRRLVPDVCNGGQKAGIQALASTRIVSKQECQTCSKRV
jgi:hypothetical protein